MSAERLRHLPIAGSPLGSKALGDELPSYALPPPPNDSESGAEAGDERLLQIGDIAKAAGKTVRAIHHYEQVGLLRPHARSKGRFRLYDQAALTRLRWIGKMHDLGLSLPQIQQIVEAWERASSAPGAMAQIRGVYRDKLEQTREQIKRLAGLERELAASLEYLETCQTCDPAELVAACSNCNHHERSLQGNPSQPEMVAGIHGGRCGCSSEAPSEGAPS